MTEKIIDVTAAVIKNKIGKIFLARRCGGHLSGKWEFPGGKIERNETAAQCLARELFEEFGVVADVKTFIAQNIHHYENKTVRLIAYEVVVTGSLIPRVHDQTVWVTPAELLDMDLAPADVPIAKAVCGKINSAE